jgi:hypothetical protein
MDRWFAELKAAYPAHRLTTGNLTERAFFDVLHRASDGAESAFRRMLANLENHKIGREWRDSKFVPKLEKWLLSGAWEQQHEAEDAPAAGRTGVTPGEFDGFAITDQEGR